MGEVELPWGPPLGQVQDWSQDWNQWGSAQQAMPICNIRLAEQPREPVGEFQELGKGPRVDHQGYQAKNSPQEYWELEQWKTIENDTAKQQVSRNPAECA